ncbi:hypothetical protein BARVI_02650 [Barnesiella viscericola DSM 18177]|uniref:Uncharacterized protein n=1 Tax=Barnesiella viscericola DSM 18177 TaxID=880074 RepID=W0EWL9_9BACT|nr:hypothetical protein BARVI_02650 [Barnesiella viscericola DSM 18177]
MFVFFLFLFILLSSEKNEPRSAAAVIGPRRSQAAPASGAAELASGSDSPRPVPSSRLARSCPIKAGFCDLSIFSPYSSLSVILLIAFFHRPDGFALRSFRTPMRNSGIPGRGIPPATSAWAPHHVRGGMGGLPKPPMHWITLYSMQNVFLLWGSGVGDFYFKRERRV